MPPSSTVPLMRIQDPSPFGRPSGPGGSDGPAPFALWALGFRPFYLLAAALAVLAVPMWVAQLSGWTSRGAALTGVTWHAHEMVFGYALAVVIGFLFTAGRNWSGQPTPTGRSLMVMAGLWVAARVLLWTPWPVLAAVVNVAVPWAAAWGLWRALRAGDNRRNYFFVGLLLLMGAAVGMVHLAHLRPDLAMVDRLRGLGLPLAMDVLLFMIAVMAGRVVPMFSNNGVPGMNARRVPQVERVALISLLLLTLFDAAGVAGPLGVGLLLVAAAVHTVRWWLWQPWRTWRQPLVWVLHAAYAWLPIHLLLRAAAEGGWISTGPATHALTVGLLGLTTLGMITRTARGHTGRLLRADRVETVAFAALLLAACIRVFLPLLQPAALIGSAQAAAALWSLAFALYLWRYAPWLWQARADGRPG